MDRIAWYNNLPTFRDSYQQGSIQHQTSMGYHQMPTLPMQIPYGMCVHICLCNLPRISGHLYPLFVGGCCLVLHKSQTNHDVYPFLLKGAVYCFLTGLFQLQQIKVCEHENTVVCLFHSQWADTIAVMLSCETGVATLLRLLRWFPQIFMKNRFCLRLPKQNT